MTRPRRRGPALALGALLSVAGCTDGDDDLSVQLPDVPLPALIGDGPPLELGELDGPAVVNLWATWCAPCRRELPAFQEASEQHPGVEFIGVDIGEDPTQAQSFLDRLGVTFPQYADRDSRLSDELGIASLPVTLLVDANARTKLHLGPMSTAQLDAALAELG